MNFDQIDIHHPTPTSMHMACEALLEVRRAARIHGGLDRLITGPDETLVEIMEQMRRWMPAEDLEQADGRASQRVLQSYTVATREQAELELNRINQGFYTMAAKLGTPCPNRHPPTTQKYCPVCHKRVASRRGKT